MKRNALIHSDLFKIPQLFKKKNQTQTHKKKQSKAKLENLNIGYSKSR